MNVQFNTTTQNPGSYLREKKTPATSTRTVSTPDSESEYGYLGVAITALTAISTLSAGSLFWALNIGQEKGAAKSKSMIPSTALSKSQTAFLQIQTSTPVSSDVLASNTPVKHHAHPRIRGYKETNLLELGSTAKGRFPGIENKIRQKIEELEIDDKEAIDILENHIEPESENPKLDDYIDALAEDLSTKSDAEQDKELKKIFGLKRLTEDEYGGNPYSSEDEYTEYGEEESKRPEFDKKQLKTKQETLQPEIKSDLSLTKSKVMIDVSTLDKKETTAKFKDIYESGKKDIVFAVAKPGHPLKSEIAAYVTLKRLGVRSAYRSHGTTTDGRDYIELEWIDGVFIQGEEIVGKALTEKDILDVINGKKPSGATESGLSLGFGAEKPKINEHIAKKLERLKESLAAILDSDIIDTQFIVETQTGTAVVIDPLAIGGKGKRNNEGLPMLIDTIGKMLKHFNEKELKKINTVNK